MMIAKALSDVSLHISKSQQAVLKKQYHELLTSSGWFVRNVGILGVKGRDALDFLHRLSTNDIKDLKPSYSVQTVLTTDKAKIIDLITVVRLQNELLLITSHDNQLRVKEWLDEFIIMDDVQITDVTGDYETFSVVGHQAVSMINEHLSIDARVIGTLSKGEAFCSYDCLIFQEHMWTIIPVFTVILRYQHNPHGSHKTQINISQFDPRLYDVLRIEQGIPVLGRELTEHVNPLEAGLSNYVSFSKGCYIGQEVIARLETYGKLQKKLTGFVFDEDIAEQLSPGKILENDKEIGWTTSSCKSLNLDKQIAIGYCRINTSSLILDYLSEDKKSSSSVRLIALPFV